LHEAGKQSSSQGTSNMVVTLCPVQTFAREGTPPSSQRFCIDLEGTQQTFAPGRKYERVSTIPEYISPQQLASQSNCKHARKMVITRPGKAQLRHSGISRIFGERT
ncbi:MAG: hypothetical protein DMG34_07270, partial [Acidobacteria bacterium]